MNVAAIAEPPAEPARTDARRAITVAILAMGGEGGGVLADWIVDMAEHAGYYAQSTSVPGVAQRTGATIYYLELFPEAAAQAKAPVLALMPIPGEVDIVLASELMEAGRAIQRGLVTPDRTTLIASTHRVYSMNEKTAMADGRVEAISLVEAGKTAAKVFVHSDFARVAEETGSVISAALFGALASTGALPFAPEQFEQAIRNYGVGVESSLAAFAAVFRGATETPVPAVVEKPKTKPAVGSRLKGLADRMEREFPPVSQAMLLAGIERLTDYQDERYAAEFLDLLGPVREADALSGTGGFALLRETARYLALWLSYEDAIRVADLKTRRSRFERVHDEARVNQAQLLQINEFLHPRIQEIADILPAGMGRWLLNSSLAKQLLNRFTQKGMILLTTSLSGYLRLYLLANLRPWRRRSLRFIEERKQIDNWLFTIPELARENYSLALEVAECPRIVKGYGDTHVNGTRNFNALMAALPELRQREDAAVTMKRLRELALADEDGQNLAAALRQVRA